MAVGQSDRSQKTCQVRHGGAAGAFFIAMRWVTWTSPAHNVLVTRNFTPLNFGSVAPGTFMSFLDDDWVIVVACAAQSHSFAEAARVLIKTWAFCLFGCAQAPREAAATNMMVNGLVWIMSEMLPILISSGMKKRHSGRYGDVHIFLEQ